MGLVSRRVGLVAGHAHRRLRRIMVGAAVLVVVVGLDATGGARLPTQAGASTTSTAPVRAAAAPAEAPRWGPTERVAAKRASEDSNGAVVRVRGEDVVALWDVPEAGHSATVLLRTSSRAPDGRWSAPRTVARVAAALAGYDLALGPDHAALVVWATGDRIARVMESHREGGVWSRPHRLGAHTASDPQPVVDGRGGMTVAWVSFPNGSRLDVATRPPKGEWSGVRHLARFGGDPDLAANRRGDVVAAWGIDNGVAVAVRRHGQDWGAPHVAHGTIGFPDRPEVAIGPHGRVLVTWTRSTDDETFTRRHLAWARSRLDGTWTSVGYLDTRRRPVLGSEVSLSMNRRGRALAVWWSDVGFGDMRAARFRFGHGWSRPHDLGPFCCYPTALLTDSDAAVALLDQTRHGAATGWAFQDPGRRWLTHRLGAVTGVVDAHGDGRRMALAYFAPRLSARVLTVPR